MTDFLSRFGPALAVLIGYPLVAWLRRGNDSATKDKTVVESMGEVFDNATTLYGHALSEVAAMRVELAESKAREAVLHSQNADQQTQINGLRAEIVVLRAQTGNTATSS